MNVVTAKGKTFLSDYFVEHQPSNSIYFRIKTDLETAQSVFGDPEETVVLTYKDRQFFSFTELDYAKDEGDAIKVRLIKDAINNNT